MNNQFTESQLTRLTKKDIVMMYISLQQLTESLTVQCKMQEKQLTEMNQKMDLLLEQMAISKQQRFGRSTEKMDWEGQFQMLFNEAEVIIVDKYVIEPPIEEVCVELEDAEPTTKRKPKQKGKRDADLKGLPVKVIEHTLSGQELHQKFGESWRRLPDEVYKRLAFQPATFEVEEHHVAVYCGNDGETIIKAPRPTSLLRNSIVTPSLEAAILNGKYVNAIPLYRMEQEFKRNGINLGRQVMANWTIRCAERYLSLVYDRMHKELLNCNVCQADETTVEVSKDGRKAGSKSYMWVYRTGKMYDESPIVLYNYQKTRNATHPEEFLKGYEGTLVTDGYAAYHAMEKKVPEIKVAGCWSHARRPFATVVKTLGKEKAKGTIAYDALRQIAAIFKLEKELSKLSTEERLNERQLTIQPLVEAFFAWIKSKKDDILPQSETGKGINYCINQEKHLKVFLTNGSVPMDNNATESTIRGFCIGRNNWKLIDTIAGAQSSAIIYSIAETAKANNLKPYEYFKYLLEEVPKYVDQKNLDFIDNLLPWSTQLPDSCRKPLESE